MASKEIAALSVSLELNSDNFTKQLQMVTRATNSMEKNFKLAQKELETTENKFKTLDKAISSGKDSIEAYGMKIDTLKKRKEEANKVLDKAKEKFERLENTLDREVKTLNELEKTVGKSSTAYENQKKVVAEAEKAYEKQVVAVGKAENQVKRYDAQIKKAEEAQNSLKTSVEKLQQEYDKFTLQKSAKSVNDFIAKMKEADNEFTKLGQNLSDIGKSMTTNVTLPLAAFGGVVTKIGIDFDTSISKCASISDDFAKNIESIEVKAREMGKATSFSAADAADGLSYMALAGWDAQTSMESIEPVLRLAEAGAMDLALASDLVTDSMGALGLESEDLQGYLDKVAKTSTISNTSIQQLMEAILNVGGTAQTLKLPMSELNAYLGILGDNGIKGAYAGTKLNSILTRMTAQSSVAAKGWKSLGVEVFDADGQFRGLTTVLSETREALAGMSEEEQQVALKAIVGTDNINAFKFMVQSTTGTVQEYTESIENSNGKLSELARIMKDNLGGDLEVLKSTFEETCLVLYKKMEPALRDIVEKVTEFIASIGELNPELLEWGLKVALVVAAVGPLLMVVGKLLTVGGNAVILFNTLKGVTAGSAGGFGLLSKAITLLSGPQGIVLLVGAITLLIAKLGENEEKLSSLQEKWGYLGEVIGSVCEHMSGVVQLSIGNICILIGTLGKSILALLKGDFKSIDDIWSEGWAKMENNTAKAMSNINYESTNGIALMREMTEIELNNLTNTFDVALKELPKLTADNANEMADIFVTRMQGLDTDTLTILRGTSDTMAVLFEGIYENMSREDAHKKFTSNLESMAKSGEFNSDKISEDIANAMQLIDRHVMDGSERVKSSAEDMFENLSSISQFGMDATVENVVGSVNKMSDETISQLASMGGHWQTLFGGIALTGKESVGDMEAHIRGRLEAMAVEHPEFIAQMKEQMTLYFEQANVEGSASMDTLSTNVETELAEVEKSMSTHTENGANSVDTNTKTAAENAKKNTESLKNSVDENTKNAGKSAKDNMDSAAKGVADATSNMAKDAKKGTSEVAKNTDTDMQKANKAVQQSATDMYNGSKKSYQKMADVAREEGTRMYLGVKTSAEKMASSAKSAATDMYRGVTTSTSRMADKAIADWNRVKNAYSRSISGTISVTKTEKTSKANLVPDMQNIQDMSRSIEQVSLSNIDTGSDMYRRSAITPFGLSSSNNIMSSIMDGINSNSLNTSNRESSMEKLLLQILQTLQGNQTVVEVPVYLDGRQIAKTTAPYMQSELDTLTNRRNRLSGISPL